MKPRVLQLIGNLHAAGSERQAAQLVQALYETSRYEVFVACMDARGELGEELAQAGIRDIPAFHPNSFYGWTMLTQLTQFARFLRARKIDIVQTHDFYTNVFGMMGAWLARVPVRIAARRETAGWRTPAQLFVERRAYKLAHAIVANAEAVGEQLRQEGVREDKIVTIYNGLQLARVTSQQSPEAICQRFELPPPAESRFVTILANLYHPVKDHPTFLRAAQQVWQAVPEARFVIAGEGGLKDKLRALAQELGVAHVTYFTGRCEQVADLLSVSEVCVLSSTAEGFSNAILEYMGAGRPVVATNVGGAREAVREGETGYLVEARDNEAMAARIVQLLQHPERARAMGRVGQQLVARRFSCDAQLAQTEQLYDRLLARNTSAADTQLVFGGSAVRK